LAKAVTHVAPDMAQGANPSCVAMLISDLFERAELEPRSPNGFIGRKSGAYVRGHLLFQVKAQFVVEVLLDRVSPNE
jgi:hypothetical protein